MKTWCSIAKDTSFDRQLYAIEIRSTTGQLLQVIDGVDIADALHFMERSQGTTPLHISVTLSHPDA